jgi:hypothetical protein
MDKFDKVLIGWLTFFALPVISLLLLLAIYQMITGGIMTDTSQPTPEVVECVCECQGGTAEDLLIIDTEYKVE